MNEDFAKRIIFNAASTYADDLLDVIDDELSSDEDKKSATKQADMIEQAVAVLEFDSDMMGISVAEKIVVQAAEYRLEQLNKNNNPIESKVKENLAVAIAMYQGQEFE